MLRHAWKAEEINFMSPWNEYETYFTSTICTIYNIYKAVYSVWLPRHCMSELSNDIRKWSMCWTTHSQSLLLGIYQYSELCVVEPSWTSRLVLILRDIILTVEPGQHPTVVVVMVGYVFNKCSASAVSRQIGYSSRRNLNLEWDIIPHGWCKNLRCATSTTSR